MTTRPEESKEIRYLYRQLRTLTQSYILPEQWMAIRRIWKEAKADNQISRPYPKVHPLLHVMQTAYILAQEMSTRRSSVEAAMLYHPDLLRVLDDDFLQQTFGTSAYNIIQGLKRIGELAQKGGGTESENYRNLMLSFAQDGRAVIIMIAERLNAMRHIDDYPEEMHETMARSAVMLYAPLAHRMGLYAMKTELEDRSLQFSQSEVYQEITRKLAESKQVREAYIARFIEPIRAKISEAIQEPFTIKGRTKSVHSIWNKIKNKQLTFEDIYDIFAIRVIIDAPAEKEKALCWLVYSIVTDMYQPNPSRTRDWLSIPKSNGYESLHTTVLGPEDKWVEVQIRSTRMNEIAEKGLAAHWRYKGIKSEKGLDEMLTQIREALENRSDDDDFKMEMYSDEIYIFTPKGELFKLPAGATVLDFAYAIHTNLGNKCVGAKVNDKNVPIRYRLKSGDSVEIQTGNNQQPKQDWLNFVVTSRARNKIKQTLKENVQKLAEFGRDALMRRMKNRKIEFEEPYLMRLVKRFKHKTVTDFFAAIGEGRLDTNLVIEAYLELLNREKTSLPVDTALFSAENYAYDAAEERVKQGKDDVLVIDQNLKGLEFKMSRCCNPIYGDDVFGFVSVTGGIKVHRLDCPNASQLRERYPYRVVKARWAGQGEGSQYTATLQIIGKDDIGIVTNITSLISKDFNVNIRSIRIDSTDGLFRGFLTLVVSDAHQLAQISKKIMTVRGVKQVIRE
ncbi:MAG: bifunctional (p)ppGpp synthetase/guanosine-3',5'-bis(diphosphate) 3'-pyrophosphohydrolase [Bacteroidales bacterium]|nr:bifunctional (p)ppGpp synthetase/guanosine-3',5'-bis(diphosphate) 3'-pyrophosphohydrolase [Bacteroidales bacterium]MBO5917069.1 bifunctional (p)ppGpp synthetase/guanosine-3',5'-bis(diphosphate) 3'-pyrophosphohydrolase [Bacteroidales bacterium]